ncbi:hypothetical protein J7L02_00595 [Candidatus Woesearchaeota archaeon]|nr:hypothetical protein [Candidatus Woesearchaeota archaeon]
MKHYQGLELKMESEIASKKSMSPLLATILLIAFAVAIGALIINITINVKTTSCENIELSLKLVGDKTTFCYAEQEHKIKFVIENTGQQSIDGVSLRIIDANLNVLEKDLQGSMLKPGQVLYGSFPFEKKSKVSVEIIPFIVEGESKKVLCHESSIEVSDLKNC